MTAPKEITVEELNALLKGAGVFVLDVREMDEWNAGHLAQARHIPLGDVAKRAQELPKDKQVVITCRSGGRSGKACDLLRGMGFGNVTNLAGGMRAWAERIDNSMVVI